MKNKIKVDKVRRDLFLKNEVNRCILKFLSYNENYKLKDQWKYKTKLTRLHKNSCFSRIRDFCVLTGRSRSVIKNFKLSRIVFREKASFNKLPGVKKSSW